jgi:alpha-galactosidase
VAVEYHDFPTVEWTLYFRNDGKRPTPILEQIQAIDTQFERSAEGEFLLHHGKGSTASTTDYEPLETELARNADLRITTSGGRPTNSDLCYFNLQWPGQGVIVALGWPGQWAADFQRDEGTALRVQAGQELTHFKLLPGEEVRTPLVALVFWRGDWIDGQNTWRRWMIAHNVPRQGGKLPPPQLDAETDIITNIMLDATETNQKALIDRYVDERIPLDYWWMDAGWYKFNKQWFGTGTWEVDTERFPHGLRAITDYLHTKNIKSIVWFEPERVTPGTWLYENHPEWLLTAPSSDKRTNDRGWKLLNLGNPEAWQWLSNHIDKMIDEQGIDLYRQDFNINPLSFWRANDAPDRQGITEIKYVEGYLAYFDFLRTHHSDILIDTCASGGRRNDLETLRRAVPLWRSDYDFEPAPMQNITYGIDLWIPYFGTGLHRLDPYSFRSDMCPATILQLDVRRKDLDYDAVRTLCAQWRRFADFYYGDYYPLTSYSTESDTWMALQFNRPEKGAGAVEVFRRPDSPFEAARFKLRGLDSGAQYTITNLDGSNVTHVSGQELSEKGLPVTIEEEPGSALFVYQRSK